MERFCKSFAAKRGRSRGGRSWRAHLALTHMNLGPIIPGNQIEDALLVLQW
jgi:hypothetical protein